jgi:hypothetical protein
MRPLIAGKKKSCYPVPLLQELIKPYYIGWVVQKYSAWLEELNAHILLAMQVFPCRKNTSSIFKKIFIGATTRMETRLFCLYCFTRQDYTKRTLFLGWITAQ